MSGTPVTCVILAGGLGSRLGGADKGLVSHGGRPLVEWVIERMRSQADEMLISANRNLDRYALYGQRVIRDLNAGSAGPLAGLQAALHAATHDLVLCVPCDTPNLPADLASRLRDALTGSGSAVAVAATTQGWQPTVCMAHRTASGALDAFLASGQRRARDWISQQSHSVVTFSHDDDFANLNTADAFSPPPRTA